MVNLRLDTRQFEKDLGKFLLKVDTSLDATVKRAADQIATETNTMDFDIPEVARSTDVFKTDNGYLVNKGGRMAFPELAAYSEFGTGDFAKFTVREYPQEWQDLAMSFFVNGKGRLPATPSLFTAFNRNIIKLADKAAKEIDK